MLINNMKILLLKGPYSGKCFILNGIYVLENNIYTLAAVSTLKQHVCDYISHKKMVEID